MIEAAPTKRRLQLALTVVMGILVVAAAVTLAMGRTGASMALGFATFGLFSISVATRLVPIRGQSGPGR